MSENRPRDIPVIDVQLLDTENIVANLPVVSKDFMSFIFGQYTQNKLMYTYSPKEYIDCVSQKPVSIDSNPADGSKIKPFKWLVTGRRTNAVVTGTDEKFNADGFVLLGGYLILKPSIHDYQTTLSPNNLIKK